MGAPLYAPISYENIDADRYYFALMVAPPPPLNDGEDDQATPNYTEMLIYTGHAHDWKTEERLRPELLAIRQFKRQIDIDRLLELGALIADDAPDEEEPIDPEYEDDYPDGNDGRDRRFRHRHEVLEFDGQPMNQSEFEIAFGESDRAFDAFRRLEYALDDNGHRIGNEWTEQEPVFTYPMRRENIMAQIDPARFGYVIYAPVQGGRRRRRTVRRRRGRRALSRRRR